MFYLMTHSTHFIYGYMASDIIMVKLHSDSKKGNLLPPHTLLFPINSKGSFICTILDRIAHTMAFVTPVVEHWLDKSINAFNTPLFLSSFFLLVIHIQCLACRLPVSPTAQIPPLQGRYYLTTHSTHFIYGYMASDIWYRIT